MEPWILSTLLATLLYGALNFLFKVAAERGHDADSLVNVVGLSVAIMATAVLAATAPRPWRAFSPPVFAYAAFNSLFFALGSLAKFGALARAPAAVVFPLNRLNTVGVMLIGFLFFGETPGPFQSLGILAGFGVLGAVALEERSRAGTGRSSAHAAGILLAVASALFTSLSMTVGKLLADSHLNRIAYVAASYALVYFFTLARTALRPKCVPPPSRRSIPRRRERVVFGVAIGALNFAGYYLVLKAFGSGPISLSQAIFSSSIVVPILLSRWIYREKLTPLRHAALALAILSVALISLD